ncbi:cobalamin (vitamin B12) biosynthesis CbiX protein [Kribbella flavida DSM 17836]|uniref:Cobalamin (Vitamin B12) biosynthesis CbiX protein n=1 Tax=Kribbella flavida (strain DSM 17836 / JCM 10339 / NBRC 14399) TaxID=479435 RepID=D2PKK4_KRIFD|nr:sirohydrochlorin chelatase [Kribbella flavida]ADB30516.1 cobalamin (vitamin B12) biosynthesis CbiX protein [Kribbella flavida DSM 17836]
MTDLVAAAHGTADPRGIRAVHSLVRIIARLRPEVPVSLGFVDVDTPALPSLMTRVVADSNRAVVVPLLLSSGYHVAVDVLGEATRRPDQVAAAEALGPDPVLAEILADRLAASLRPDGDVRGVDRVVLAAAGSSDRRALLDCSAVAASLAALVNRPVEVGYVSGAGERLGAVLERTPGRVAVATYLLAPGFFADRIATVAARAGATASAPLGPDPRLATLALRRFDEAVARRWAADPSEPACACPGTRRARELARSKIVGGH